MVDTLTDETELGRRLVEVLQRLPDLRNVHWQKLGTHVRDRGLDGRVQFTIAGRRTVMDVQFKAEIRDRDAATAFLIRLKKTANRPVLFATRYMPPLAGEGFVREDINFVDFAGNAHIHVRGYRLTQLGKPAPRELRVRRRRGVVTPAFLKLAYVLLARPERRWKTRELAEAAGVALGRTVEVLATMRDDGLVRRVAKRAGEVVQNRDRLLEIWLHDYAAVLRPQLVLGTFKPLLQAKKVAGMIGAAIIEPPLEEVVAQWGRGLRKWPEKVRPRFALTGTWGAAAVVHHYRGPRLVLFVEPPVERWMEMLRILPDPGGTVTLLERVAPLQWADVIRHVRFEKRRTPARDGLPIAPPLLLYAELLADPDPRAREEAEHLIETFPELRHGG